MSDAKETARFVATLGDEIFPTDIFTPMTEQNWEDIKKIHELFPNLISRFDAFACRRAFNLASEKILERETERLELKAEETEQSEQRA